MREIKDLARGCHPAVETFFQQVVKEPEIDGSR